MQRNEDKFSYLRTSLAHKIRHKATDIQRKQSDLLRFFFIDIKAVQPVHIWLYTNGRQQNDGCRDTLSHRQIFLAEMPKSETTQNKRNKLKINNNNNNLM